jgi:hypothetical protein
LKIELDGLVFCVGWISAQQKRVLIEDCSTQWRDEISPAPSLCLLCERDSPDVVLARLVADLHRAGHIGWRGELYAVREETSGRKLALIERAAAKFLGLVTVGAHCNGYVVDHRGRPSHLWIGKRALSKAIDPGLLDNLVGCGVPWPQSPDEAVIREGWEEAGFPATVMRGATLQDVHGLDRQDVGGRHRQLLHIYDLMLPQGLVPRNLDGEVESYLLLATQEITERLRAGQFTPDAAVATLDFLFRYRLVEIDIRGDDLGRIWQQSVGVLNTYALDC